MKNGYADSEKFELVEQRLIENYNDIMGQMGLVSKMMKENPQNSDLKNLLCGLAETATKIISTQISFAHTYAPDERYKERVIEKLMKKRQQLLSDVATDLTNVEEKSKTR